MKNIKINNQIALQRKRMIKILNYLYLQFCKRLDEEKKVKEVRKMLFRVYF